MNVTARLIELLGRWTGIDLARGGRSDVLQRFVLGRLQELHLPSIESYTDSLTGSLHPEVPRLVCAITVPHTWFYRDGEQMEVIAKAMRELRPREQTLHVWVPGCATGEDAYTIALLGMRERRPVRVLGTDINPEVIEHARKGRYCAWSTRELPPAFKAQMSPLPDGRLEIPASMRADVSFAVHNLMDPPLAAPTGSGWDLILCRNVLIYFQRPQLQATLARLGRALESRGLLFLGAGEAAYALPPELELATLGPRYALRRPTAEKPRTAPVASPPSREKLPLPPPRLPVAEPVPVAQVRPAASRAPAQLHRAGVLLNSHKIAEAIAIYAAILEQEPLCVEARLFMGIAHHIGNDVDGAIRTLRSALFLDPQLWPAAFYLALSYETVGDAGAAQREYQRVVDTRDCALSLRISSEALADLEAWKPEVVMLARQRARRSRFGRLRRRTAQK